MSRVRARGLEGLEGGQHFFGEERHALCCPFARHHSVAHLADQLAEARGLLGTEQCLEHFLRRVEGADIERGGTDGFDGCFEFGGVGLRTDRRLGDLVMLPVVGGDLGRCDRHSVRAAVVLDRPELVEAERFDKVAQREIVLEAVEVGARHRPVLYSLHRSLLHVGHVLEPDRHSDLHRGLLR